MGEISKVDSLGNLFRPKQLLLNTYRENNPFTEETSNILENKYNELRESMLVSNIYKIDSPYDLNSDFLSRSLNLLDSLNLNTRKYELLDVLERLIDSKNSKIVQESGKYLTKQLLLKGIDTGLEFTFDKIRSKLNPATLTTKDFIITNTDLDPNKSIQDKIIEKTFGIRYSENPIDSFSNEQTNEANYYFLGKGQKIILENQMSKNFYTNYLTSFDPLLIYDESSPTIRAMYNRDYVRTMFVNYQLGNASIFKRGYINDIESNGLFVNFTDFQKNIENEGFGRVGDNTPFESDEKFYYSSDKDLQNTINDKYNVKRGLLYYTSQVANEPNSPIWRSDEKGKTVKDGVIWRGNGECRSYTVSNQYNNFSKVIRFNGNGQENSVIKDTVIPKLLKSKNDTKDTKYFLSFENLAWKNSKNLIDYEKGPNGGRYLAFMPYNLKFNDNASIDVNETAFVGRPEKIYIPNNHTRSMSLSFSLLIDTVKQFDGYTTEEFKKLLYNCGVAARTFTQNNSTTTNVLTNPQTSTTTNTVVENVRYGKSFNYYFRNDAYDIGPNYYYTTSDPSYNSDNIIMDENVSIETNITSIATFIDNNINKSSKVKINIVGNTSNLDSRAYNFKLGMRRANNLMLAIVDKYNTIKSSNSPLLNNQTPKTNVNTQFDEITGNQILRYTFNNGLVIFDLHTNGESTIDTNANIDSVNVNRNTNLLNNKSVIQERFVRLASASATPNLNINTTPFNNVNQQITTSVSSSTSTVNISNDLELLFEDVKSTDNFKLSRDASGSITRVAPAFNSQTPYDFVKRYIFLHQLTRPATLENSNSPSNILFGKSPILVVRIGDFIYSKAVLRNINFDLNETTWDFNPEGMGAIPMFCNVTMDLILIGGQSLETPIDRIQTANDFNFIAPSTFGANGYQNRIDYKPAINQRDQQLKLK